MAEPSKNQQQQHSNSGGDADKIKTARTLAILSFPAILITPVNYILAIVAIVQANSVSGHDAEKKSVKKIAIASIITAIALIVLFFILFFLAIAFVFKRAEEIKYELDNGDYSVLDDSSDSDGFVSNSTADQVREDYLQGCALAPGHESYCECTADELGSDGITRLEQELLETGELPQEANDAIAKCLDKIVL